MLEVYFKTVRDTTLKQIDDFRAGSWIYAKEATPDDLQKISQLTGLELSEIRDSLDKYELPRIEQINGNILFFARHPGEAETGLYTQTLTILLTPQFVIAISPHQSDLIEQLLQSNTPLGTTQKSKLLLHIFLKITQEYTNAIKKLRHSTLGAEQPTIAIDTDAILILTKNEEILNQYLTALVPMRNALETISSGRSINLYEEDLDLLDDLMIAIRQSEDVCRVNIKSIRSLRDSYHIIFTNDVNRTIKLLTALTIVFTIPTIIASIYGMNVALPFAERPSAFWMIMGGTLIASLLAVFFFKKRHWL